MSPLTSLNFLYYFGDYSLRMESAFPHRWSIASIYPPSTQKRWGATRRNA